MANYKENQGKQVELLLTKNLDATHKQIKAIDQLFKNILLLKDEISEDKSKVADFNKNVERMTKEILKFFASDNKTNVYTHSQGNQITHADIEKFGITLITKMMENFKTQAVFSHPKTGEKTTIPSKPSKTDAGNMLPAKPNKYGVVATGNRERKQFKYEITGKGSSSVLNIDKDAIVELNKELGNITNIEKNLKKLFSHTDSETGEIRSNKKTRALKKLIEADMKEIAKVAESSANKEIRQKFQNIISKTSMDSLEDEAEHVVLSLKAVVEAVAKRFELFERQAMSGEPNRLISSEGGSLKQMQEFIRKAVDEGKIDPKYIKEMEKAWYDISNQSPLPSKNVLNQASESALIKKRIEDKRDNEGKDYFDEKNKVYKSNKKEVREFILDSGFKPELKEEKRKLDEELEKLEKEEIKEKKEEIKEKKEEIKEKKNKVKLSKKQRKKKAKRDQTKWKEKQRIDKAIENKEKQSQKQIMSTEGKLTSDGVVENEKYSTIVQNQIKKEEKMRAKVKAQIQSEAFGKKFFSLSTGGIEAPRITIPSNMDMMFGGNLGKMMENSGLGDILPNFNLGQNLTTQGALSRGDMSDIIGQQKRFTQMMKSKSKDMGLTTSFESLEGSIDVAVKGTARLYDIEQNLNDLYEERKKLKMQKYDSEDPETLAKIQKLLDKNQKIIDKTQNAYEKIGEESLKAIVFNLTGIDKASKSINDEVEKQRKEMKKIEDIAVVLNEEYLKSLGIETERLSKYSTMVQNGNNLKMNTKDQLSTNIKVLNALKDELEIEASKTEEMVEYASGKKRVFDISTQTKNIQETILRLQKAITDETEDESEIAKLMVRSLNDVASAENKIKKAKKDQLNFENEINDKLDFRKILSKRLSESANKFKMTASSTLNSLFGNFLRLKLIIGGFVYTLKNVVENQLRNFIQGMSQLVSFNDELVIMKSSLASIFDTAMGKGNFQFADMLFESAKRISTGATNVGKSVKGLPIVFKDVIQTMKQMSSIPALRGKLFESLQPENQLNALKKLKKDQKITQSVFDSLVGDKGEITNTLKATQTIIDSEVTNISKAVMSLTNIDPTQGTEGALFTLREALSGDFISLKKRFEIKPEFIAQSIGASVEYLKKNPQEFIRGLNQFFEDNFKTLTKTKVEETFEGLYNIIQSRLSIFVSNISMGANGIGEQIIKNILKPIDKELKKFFKSDSSTNLAKYLQDQFGVLLDEVKNTLVNLIPLIEETFELKSDSFLTPFQKLEMLVQKIVSKVIEITKYINDTLTGNTKEIAKLLQNIWGFVRDITKEVFSYGTWFINFFLPKIVWTLQVINENPLIKWIMTGAFLGGVGNTLTGLGSGMMSIGSNVFGLMGSPMGIGADSLGGQYRSIRAEKSSMSSLFPTLNKAKESKLVNSIIGIPTFLSGKFMTLLGTTVTSSFTAFIIPAFIATMVGYGIFKSFQREASGSLETMSSWDKMIFNIQQKLGLQEEGPKSIKSKSLEGKALFNKNDNLAKLYDEIKVFNNLYDENKNIDPRNQKRLLNDRTRQQNIIENMSNIDFEDAMKMLAFEDKTAFANIKNLKNQWESDIEALRDRMSPNDIKTGVFEQEKNKLVKSFLDMIGYVIDNEKTNLHPTVKLAFKQNIQKYYENLGEMTDKLLKENPNADLSNVLKTVTVGQTQRQINQTGASLTETFSEFQQMFNIVQNISPTKSISEKIIQMKDSIQTFDNLFKGYLDNEDKLIALKEPDKLNRLKGIIQGNPVQKDNLINILVGQSLQTGGGLEDYLKMSEGKFENSKQIRSFISSAKSLKGSKFFQGLEGGKLSTDSGVLKDLKSKLSELDVENKFGEQIDTFIQSISDGSVNNIEKIQKLLKDDFLNRLETKADQLDVSNLKDVYTTNQNTIAKLLNKNAKQLNNEIEKDTSKDESSSDFWKTKIKKVLNKDISEISIKNFERISMSELEQYKDFLTKMKVDDKDNKNLYEIKIGNIQKVMFDKMKYVGEQLQDGFRKEFLSESDVENALIKMQDYFNFFGDDLTKTQKNSMKTTITETKTLLVDKIGRAVRVMVKQIGGILDKFADFNLNFKDIDMMPLKDRFQARLQRMFSQQDTMRPFDPKNVNGVMSGNVESIKTEFNQTTQRANVELSKFNELISTQNLTEIRRVQGDEKFLQTAQSVITNIGSVREQFITRYTETSKKIVDIQDKLLKNPANQKELEALQEELKRQQTEIEKIITTIEKQMGSSKDNIKKAGEGDETMTPMEAMRQGWMDAVNEYKSFDEMLAEASRETGRKMDEAIGNGFFELFKGNVEDAKDVFDNFMKEMESSFLRATAEMAKRNLLQAIFGQETMGGVVNKIFGVKGNDNGSMVTSPTLALIGERANNNPEWIFNNNQLNAIISKSIGMAGGSVASKGESSIVNNITVNAPIDAKGQGDETIERLQQQMIQLPKMVEQQLIVSINENSTVQKGIKNIVKYGSI